jgi:hypothetical protein
MDEQNNFALIPNPPRSVEKVAPGAKRILFGIITDTLALAKKEHISQSGAKFQVGDFEIDGKIITAVGELANLYVKDGVTTFEQFAEIVKKEMPSIWNQAKIYLRLVWNTVADMNGFRDVSRDEANVIFAALEQPTTKDGMKLTDGN